MDNVGNQTIADRIVEVKNDLGYRSIRAFSLALDADPSLFTKILKGERKLPAQVMVAMQNKFKVRSFWLLNGTGDKYLTDEEWNKVKDMTVYPSLSILDTFARPPVSDLAALNDRYIQLQNDYITQLKKISDEKDRANETLQERTLTYIADTRFFIEHLQSLDARIKKMEEYVSETLDRIEKKLDRKKE